MKQSRLYFVVGLIGLLVTSGQSFAQDNKEQLGVQYYQNEEYEKALPIFEDLFEENRSSSYLYEYYLNTLLKLKKLDDAEDMLEKQSRKFQGKLQYMVDLGYIHKLQDDKKKMKKTYEKVLDKLSANKGQIQIVANKFKNRGAIDYAIQTYQKGRKLLNNEKAFGLALARLYRKNDDYEPMFEAYLTALQVDPQSKGLIQGELQELVMNEEPYRVFRNVLLDKIKSNPNQRQFIDMLSWLFIQNEDYHAAFIQLRALQKRLNTNGRRLIDLAEITRENKALQTAESIYEYIVSLGPSNPYYFKARQGVLDVQYDRITKLGEYDSSDLLQLEKYYEKFMKDERFTYAENGKVVLRLAEIKASYLDNVEGAIDLLKPIAESNLRGNKTLKARVKLALGDYYLLKGNIWDAQLAYSQVEKMFEDHPLGHTAKFRNAKLSFYKGDFNWASSQLEILKGATSELISNDAIQLEMLIKDNRGLDTTEVPLEIYARADLHIFKNNYDKANKYLDSILNRFPGHNLTDEIYYAKANIAKQRRNYDTALHFYEKVYSNFSQDLLADDALFEAAKLYEERLDNPEKAKALYEKLIMDYKGSVFKLNARERFRKIRGDVVN